MLIIEDPLDSNNLCLDAEMQLLSIRKCANVICQLTAYADWDTTLAIMVIRTCSLTVNGPGLREIPNKDTFGR
jgi:hypothetical protein